MKLKEVTKIIKKNKVIKYLNPEFSAKFSNVEYFIIRLEKKVKVLEYFYYDNNTKIERLSKDLFKELKLKKYKKYYRVLDLEKKEDFKAEKLMKLALYKELIGNYTSGSIISEYTHTNLHSRADFAIFENGECHIFELKSNKDNLSKLKKQVKEYKKYATKVFVVINEKHYKNYLKLKIKNVNLIIESNHRFQLKELNVYNEVNKDLSYLIWHKEKEHLFSYVKNQKDFSLNNKMEKLKKIVNINELTFKILEERYKVLSDDCRENYMNIFKSRNFCPSKRNIKFFYPDFKMNFLLK